MAGVFKSLDKSDIRIVPFRAHKQWVNDLSYTLTPTPSQSVTYGGPYLSHLQTNFVESVINGTNYYYYVGEGGNIYQVDGTDDYALLSQTNNNPYIFLPFVSSAGATQDYIMYYNAYTSTLCVHRASDLQDVDVDTYSVPSKNYSHLAWIPTANMILLSGEESVPEVGLISVTWDDSLGTFTTSASFNTSASTNYLGTTAAPQGNFFAAYVQTGSLSRVYFEYKRLDAVLFGVTAPSPGLPYIPTAVKDFVCNGDGAQLSAFATMKGGVGLWLINGTPTAGQLPYTKYDYDVVRLLQDKDIYRYGNEVVARTFAVLRNGTILLDLYANSTGYGWQDQIDVRRWIGSGEIIAATINKNVDLIAPTEPLKITIYARTDLTQKAPTVIFSVNLNNKQVSDPIPLRAYFNESSTYTLFGDDGGNTVNLVGENRANKVVGLTHPTIVVDLSNQTPYSVYSQIYTFNT